MIGPPANPSRTGALMPGMEIGIAPKARPMTMPINTATKFGSFQAFHSIAQHLLHILYSSGFAHYGQAVTQLQGQFRCGQQLHAATINPADIDTVMITQMERTQLLAVQLRARHHDTLRNQLAVYGIPVYIFPCSSRYAPARRKAQSEPAYFSPR